MFNLTPEQFNTTWVVLTAVFAALFTIDTVIDLFKKWRKPAKDMQATLEEHDREIRDVTNKVNALCKAEVAHLTHELTGQGTNELQAALTDLTSKLVEGGDTNA